MPKINKLPTEEELFAKFSRQCAMKECAPADIKLKVMRAGLDNDTAERIVDRLIDDGYIDEKRYVRAFVHDKFIFNHWGRRKIVLALAQKGLRGSFVQEILKNIDDKEYTSVLTDILRTKAKSVNAATEQERFYKLLNFAVSRGFESDVAYKVLETVLDSDDSGS